MNAYVHYCLLSLLLAPVSLILVLSSLASSIHDPFVESNSSTFAGLLDSKKGPSSSSSGLSPSLGTSFALVPAEGEVESHSLPPRWTPRLPLAS